VAVAANPKTEGLVARIPRLLLSPQTEWKAIDVEPATQGSLLFGYAAVLAAIPSGAYLLGRLVWTGDAPGALSGAIVSYVLMLILTYVAALVVDGFAPAFEIRRDRVRALKLVVYSLTPYWLAGVLFVRFSLYAFSWLAGLYAFFLVFLGVPRLMKVEGERAVVYAIVAMICVGLAFNLAEWALWRAWW
jgi:hypothetical protein